MEVEQDPKKRGIGKTVLVVDDSAPLRKMLADAFLSDGFKTCGEAGNGKEAIELAKQLKPDVITLDFAMPVMDGLTAASELRRVLPKTPIILLTLYADALSKNTTSEAGVNLVLEKGVSLYTLIDRAHELIESINRPAEN